MFQASVQFSPPLDVLGTECRNWAIKTVAKAGVAMRRLAARIEQWMKSNARWRDRTGEARAQLRAYAEISASLITVYIVHGVSYGIFLELMEAGTYAIVKPALDYWTPRMMDELRMNMR